MEPAAATARFRIPPGAFDRDDPIVKVNEAVRAVLAELRGPIPTRKEPGCQLFLDKLLAVRQAEALPRGTRVVLIGPGTVVTPLARDLLKRRGITIRLGGTRDAQNRVHGQWAFALEADSGLEQALRRAFLEDPRVWYEVEPSLEDVAGWLGAEEGRGALWITTDVALAIWRACRREGIRAASAVEPADVHRAVRSLGINLLLVDPTGKSISWIRQLASAFRVHGAPLLPEPLMVEAM
ncbi:MAG: hypothetical protein ACP5XB_27530 [Isosphaeraceae bacterium]